MTNNHSTIVLQCLRAKVEYDHGNGWGEVYLDNARPVGMSVHAFRACLAALARANLYRPIDGYAFGDVKLED